MNTIKKCTRLVFNNERESSKFLLSKRWKVTAPAVGIEIVKTKSYDEIPGAFSLPLIGTAWTMLPFIGGCADLTIIFSFQTLKDFTSYQEKELTLVVCKITKILIIINTVQFGVKNYLDFLRRSQLLDPMILKSTISIFHSFVNI